jgi:molybdopterin synthase catalytic subunit
VALDRFAVTADPLDVQAAVRAAQHAPDGDARGIGAVCTFVGVVRPTNQGRTVRWLEYEAYPPLAARTFARIAEEARERWPGASLAIHHRMGRLEIGDASVVIAAATAHRPEAYAACRYAIERVKQIAPIWKREYFEGGDAWIEGATADPDDREARDAAMRRACA